MQGYSVKSKLVFVVTIVRSISMLARLMKVGHTDVCKKKENFKSASWLRLSYCCEFAVDWRQPELKAVMDTFKKIYFFPPKASTISPLK